MQNAVRADVFLKSLALAVARNEVGASRPIAEVLKTEGIQLVEYQEIEQNPTFQSYLSKYTQELKESGFSFEAKCKLLAEDMLPGFYHLGRDPDTPAPVRAKVMEQLVKWANLEPKNDIALGGNAGFSINIVLPGESSGEKTTITANIQQNQPTEDTDSESEAIDAEFSEIADNEAVQEPSNAPKLIPQSPNDLLAIFFNETEDYEYAGDDVYE